MNERIYSNKMCLCFYKLLCHFRTTTKNTAVILHARLCSGVTRPMLGSVMKELHHGCRWPRTTLPTISRYAASAWDIPRRLILRPGQKAYSPPMGGEMSG